MNTREDVAYALAGGGHPVALAPCAARERRLAVILSADVQGYSRLMSEDEEATIHTLMAYRAVFSTLVAQHDGRVVDLTGDNILEEFAGAVEAVKGAVLIQQALQQQNADLLPHRRMLFRIGINLGDVLVEGERSYGNGVNIAAQLEGLAEGGGICISGLVYDQVEPKLPLQYRFRGEQALSTIGRPLRVYEVRIPLTPPPVVRS